MERFVDPVTALFLRQGTVVGRSPGLADAALGLWSSLAMPHGNVPTRPHSGSLRYRHVHNWALQVEGLSEMGTVVQNARSCEGLELGYASLKYHWFVLFRLRPDGAHGYLTLLDLVWEHRERRVPRLVETIYPSWRAIEYWPDPTPVELETLAFEPRDGCRERLPPSFGMGDEGEWDLFGHTWSANVGGVARLFRGKRLVATVPSMLADAIEADARRSVGHVWEITRLSRIVAVRHP